MIDYDDVDHREVDRDIDFIKHAKSDIHFLLALIDAANYDPEK